MEDDFNWSEFVEQAMGDASIEDPFQNPPQADPVMAGQSFGNMPEDVAPVSAAPVDVPFLPMDQGTAFGSNPYSIPDLRDDPAGRLMEAAIGQTGEKIAGDYFRSGGQSWGQPTEDDRGYRQGPLGGMAQLNPDRVVDYSSTGIDTSGNNPVLRVMNMNGDQMVGKPIKDFNDLGSIPSPSAPIRDANGDYVLDDRGNRTYSPLPGFDYRRVAGAGLYPDRLENGQTVMGDRFNPGVTWSVGADGLPSRALVGGTGMENFDRQRAMAYGLVPTNSMRDGRPVYSEIVGQNPDGSPVYGRSWERNRDGNAGRQILDVNRDPRYLDGGRAGGGQGATPVRRFNPPPPPPPPTPPAFEYPDMSGLAGPNERLAAGLGSGGLGPERSPEPPSIPVQRVSQEIPVTNPNEQNALRIPPGSIKQKFDTGEGTPAIYRYTAPDGTVIITDAQGNVLQRNR